MQRNDWRFNVYATVGDVTEAAPLEVLINDDEADLSQIRLRATIGESTESPPTISELDGPTDVTITAYVIGTAPTADVDIHLTTLDGSATREVDYQATYRTLTIAAGEITGEQTITIIPEADETDDGDGKAADETIILGSTIAKADTDGIVKIGDKDIEVKRTTINLKDEKTPAPDPEAAAAVPDIVFPEDATTAISGTAGEALEEVLAEATAKDEDAEVTVPPLRRSFRSGPVV